jgi:hypothetical protein
VAVPKAAVDEDDGFVFGKDDVGAAGKVFGVEAEAEAESVKDGADEDLGLGVLAFDAGHIPRPPFFRQAVFHMSCGHVAFPTPPRFCIPNAATIRWPNNVDRSREKWCSP